MFCKLLDLLIEHAPNGIIADKLREIREEHCGGGVTANSGSNSPPPQQ